MRNASTRSAFDAKTFRSVSLPAASPLETLHRESKRHFLQMRLPQQSISLLDLGAKLRVILVRSDCK